MIHFWSSTTTEENAEIIVENSSDILKHIKKNLNHRKINKRKI